MDVVNGSDRRVPPAFLTVGLGLVLLVAPASPAAQSGFVNNLLRQERFSAADLRALDAGEAVVKSLDTPVRQELAHFGAVYIDAPADRFVDRFVDIERFERGPGIAQIERFDISPRLAEMASLTLPQCPGTPQSNISVPSGAQPKAEEQAIRALCDREQRGARPIDTVCATARDPRCC